MARAVFSRDITTQMNEFLQSGDFDAEYLADNFLIYQGDVVEGSTHLTMLFIGALAADGDDSLVSFSR